MPDEFYSRARAGRPGQPAAAARHGGDAGPDQAPGAGAASARGELLGVDVRPVAVAVVEQHVGDVGLPGQAAETTRPLVQLGVAVPVAELLRRCPCSSTCPSGRASGPRPGRWSRPAPAGSSSGSPAACPRTRTAAGARPGSPASRAGCPRSSRCGCGTRRTPGPARPAARRPGCTPCCARPIGNHGGNWSRIAPSLPASRSGSSAARNRSQTSSATAGSTSLRYTRSFPVWPAASRRSAGSAPDRVGCWVNRLNALTLKVKPGGVRSAQARAVCSAGSA